MPNRLPPASGYDLSDYQLSRSNLYNPLRDFLKYYASRDRVSQFFDFVDWNQAGASFTFAQVFTGVNFTSVDALSGAMAATTSSTAACAVSAIGKTRFNGNNNCMYEARFKINTVSSTWIIEAGWVDAAPATGASFVTDIDTPSFVGTNGAVFGVWNNQTHTSAAFASIGNFTAQTVASTLITAATATFTTPAADTYLTVRVLLLTGATGKSSMYGWVNGRLRAKHDVAAGAVNGQIALYPWLYMQSVAGAARVITADYIWVSQDRQALSAASE